MDDYSRRNAAGVIAVLVAALVLAGCESLASVSPTKRIDYKSVSSGPALELPPDLTTPRYDDRYQVSTATGLAAAGANKGTRSEFLPTTPDAKIVKAGNERWLVVKATPEQAWNTVREFWQETGFVLAVEQPQVGMMETDFAENKAEGPQDFFRRTVGKYMDIFFTTYKQDKFRTRIERGAEAGTVEIFISHRGMEQVPTGKIDNSSPAAFAWAVMPPNPSLEAEMLTRLMMKFGTPEPVARAAVVQAAIAPEKARVDRNTDGSYKLTVDDQFDRTWRRVGLALDRAGFTVIDRDRSRGVYFVRFGDPDAL
ncbi:MAG: outer membrane protein assembly factor BamC, partial [Casimicrobiaceae bacterium]